MAVASIWAQAGASCHTVTYLFSAAARKSASAAAYRPPPGTYAR